MTMTAGASTATRQTAGAAAGTARTEMPALDGLRGCAVLLVVALHLQLALESTGGSGFPGVWHVLARFGYAGLQLFFILSGFLLFLPYAPALLRLPNARWPSARQFYVRRAKRILPLYYIAVALLLLAHFRLWPLLPHLLAPLYLIALLVHDMRADATTLMYVIDPPLWSLAAEWQFYVVLPALALGLRLIAARMPRGGGLRWLVVALVGVMMAGLGVRYVASVAHYDWGFVNPQDVPGVVGFAFKLVYGIHGKYLEEFALGMLASVLYVAFIERARMSAPVRMRIGLACWALGLVGLGANVVWAATWGRIDVPQLQDGFFPAPAFRLWAVFGEWNVALSFALVLLGILLGPSSMRRVFAARPLRFVGVISFSIYVWHYPILFALAPLIGWAQAQGVRWGAAPLYVVMALTVVAGVSVASYRFIERPFLYRRVW